MKLSRVGALTALVVVFCLPAMAQNFGYGQSTGTQDPFDYNTLGTTVLAIPSEDVLSPVQSLPFVWSFYGIPRSTYYVSDNGYITFDPTAAVSDPNNNIIPSVGGPNDAIYAFWDSLGVVAGTGSTDKVQTWTYGDAPNRVHVVEWYSVTPASGSGFVYAAIRIYECGDFDIVLNYGNATGMTATIGAENPTGTIARQITGSPNIPYPAVGSGGADDVVYSFYWSEIQYDLAVTSIGFEDGGVVTLGDQIITGTVTNTGSEIVTGFDLVYQIDGGVGQVDTLSGLAVPPYGGTYDFAHSTPWNVATGGLEHQIEVFAENINGIFTDQRPCNDVFTTSVYSAQNTWGFKNVLLEVFTGAWCGWCPDGTVIRDAIIADHGPRVVAVDVHDGDAMEFPEDIRDTFGVTAYPNGMVDRTVFDGEAKEPHSRSSWETNVTEQLGAYTPLNVGVTSSFNTTTRQVDVTIDTAFTDYASGDLRFVCMLVEDNVAGLGAGWDQTNYLNTTTGHTYFGAGDPILGFNHRHVLRDISSAVGNPSVIPTPVVPGDTASESFTFILPATVDATQITVVGFVAKYGAGVGQKSVYNVQQAPLGETREVPLFASTFNSGSTTDWSTATQ